MKAENRISRGQIEWIVGNIHVGTRRRDVVKNFVQRFRMARSKGIRFTRAARHDCYRVALAAHEANRQLCREFRL